MSTGLYRLLWRRFSGIGWDTPREAAPSLRFKSALIGIAVVTVLLIGAGVWLVMSIDDGESADGGLAQIADGAPSDGAATPSQAAGPTPGVSQASIQEQAHAAAAAEPAAAPDDKPTASIGGPPPVNGLKLGSQSWRRGGLGSKALMTFTLRNDNPYAVKDVEIACAFSRRDGSHLTDRTRVVPGPVSMRSRKTFAGVHVGFVNVNASKAKCTLVAASKI
jgi:hypothetical protein